MTILDVQNLTIEYETEAGPLRAVDNIAFDLEEGETLGIVGESGCGKTTASKSVIRLLPENGRVVDGTIRFKGADVTTLSDEELRRVRWNDISYIAQNAMNALDPVYRVGSQFREVIQQHTDKSKAECRERTDELLESVGLDSNRRYDYPHELSGGQRQRVVIALALALNPSLVLADEPTTGLDVVVQDEILRLISNIQDERGISMIFVTHDMSVVAEVADRVAVMYGGQIVELGETREVFKESGHPYTMGLHNAFPDLSRHQGNLVSIPGTPPDLIDAPDGCRFADRCPFATSECETEPDFEPVSEDGHVAKCHYVNRRETFWSRSQNRETWQTVER